MLQELIFIAFIESYNTSCDVIVFNSNKKALVNAVENFYIPST